MIYYTMILYLIISSLIFAVILNHFTKIDVSINVSNFSILFTYGLSFTIIIYYIISYIYINKTIVLFISIFELLLLIYIIYNKKLFLVFERNNVVFLFLSLLFILLFENIYSNFKWAAAGDPVSHGEIISLILYNNKIPKNYEPYNSLNFNLIKYPLGYHIIISIITILAKIYPGQSMALFSTYMSIFILITMYSNIYKKTNNFYLSLIMTSLLFYIPLGYINSSPNNDLLISIINSGVYPNQLANFLIINFFIIGYNYEYQKIRFILPIIFIAILITYYPYVIISLFYYTLIIIKEKKYLNNNKNILIMLFMTLFIFLIYNNFKLDLINFFVIDQMTLLKIWEKFVIIFNELYLVLFSFFIYFIYKLRKKTQTIMDYYYIILIICFILIRYIPHLYISYLWIIFPNVSRHIMYVYALSIFFISIIFEVKTNVYKKNILKKVDIDLLLFIILILSTNLLSNSFFLYGAYKPVMWGKPLGEDYEAALWIIDNLSTNDRILNDRSWEGLFLSSFKAMSYINTRTMVRLTVKENDKYITPYYSTLIKECNSIYDKPEDYEYVYKIIKKYKIDYIHISMTTKTYWWGEYLILPYKKTDYINIFINNPYLEVIFQTNNVYIFKTK